MEQVCLLYLLLPSSAMGEITAFYIIFNVIFTRCGLHVYIREQQAGTKVTHVDDHCNICVHRFITFNALELNCNDLHGGMS